MANKKEAVKEVEKKVKPTTKKAEEKNNNLPFAMPELVSMLEAGVHFGHERSKRNPKMEQYIFMQRNRVAIFDLELTLAALEKAAKYVYKAAHASSNDILFVGTKRQARGIVKKYAEAAGQPYVTQRWLGGTLTNFSTILMSIEKLEELKKAEDSQVKLTKKARAVRTKEIERLEGVLEGIKSMKSLPSMVFVVGAHDEKLAIKEAKKVNIPVVGITDTNADPDLVDYPIPANDDAVRALDLIVGTITKSILAARKKPLETLDELSIKSHVPKQEDVVAEQSLEEKEEESA